MIILVCLQLAYFGNATPLSEDTFTCPNNWIPISGQCFAFNTNATVPYDVATGLCKEDDGLITVQAAPVEVGQYITKEFPGKVFWVGATSSADTCVSFSGLKKAYTQEDCGSTRYYVCHLQKHIVNITVPDFKPKGFQHHISEAFVQGWGNIEDAFKSGWKKVEDVFTFDEEALKNERIVDGCHTMMYNGVVHTGCTERGSSHGKEWCGTDGGIFWPGISNWKYC